MLFAGIDVEAVEDLLTNITSIRYGPGEAIYHQGEPATALYSVRSGVIKLSVSTPEGTERIVRLMGPGAAVGLESSIQQPYHEFAETLSEVSVCRIPKATLQRVAEEQPQLFLRLMEQWQEHLVIADSHLLKLSTGTVHDRVINLLHILAGLSGNAKGAFLLPGNHDCASLVATRFESVSRIMAELKRRGALTPTEDGQWLIDPDLIPTGL